MICRFQRFVWRRLACTNRFWPTLTDRFWPDRLSHFLFGQLVWQMESAGDGRGGRERGGGRRSWRGGSGGGGPGGERSLVLANISRFFVVSRPSFHMFPILCGFFSSKDPEAVGVSHGVQRAQMCVLLSVRGSVLLMKCSRGQVHDPSVSAWTQSLFELGKRLLVRSNVAPQKYPHRSCSHPCKARSRKIPPTVMHNFFK